MSENLIYQILELGAVVLKPSLFNSLLYRFSTITAI